jgi:hypothetical protein
MRMMAKTKALEEKSVPLPVVFTINPTWIGLEANPGLCSKTASLYAHNIDLQKRMASCK